jgi:hypothetical protein
MKCVLFNYDVPVNSRMANPSRRLNPLGFRVSFSCWVIPKDSLPLHLLDEMNSRGCRTSVLDFDEGEAAKIIDLAAATLNAEIQKAEAAAQNTLESLDERMAQGDETLSPKKYLYRARAATRRAERLVRDFNTAAGLFGVGLWRFDSTMARVEYLHRTVNEKAAEYARVARELADRGQDGLAAAARADTLPAGILMDAAIEAGVATEETEELLAV